MSDAEFFRFLEREMNIGQLKPDDVVEYRGPILKARGLWVVRHQVGDDRYTLAHPLNEWERLNATRDELTGPLEG